MSAAVGGPLVEKSTTHLTRVDEVTPLRPNSTSSAASLLVTQVSTTSALLAASAGSCAQRAPAASSDSALPRLRLLTVRGSPAPIRRAAMGAPHRSGTDKSVGSGCHRSP